jgi:hypothetical protein
MFSQKKLELPFSHCLPAVHARVQFCRALVTRSPRARTVTRLAEFSHNGLPMFWQDYISIFFKTKDHF